MASFDKIWSDLNQVAHEKIWKRFSKIKYVKPWMLEILCKVFDLTCSIHTQHHKPNRKRLQAAQKLNIQTWKNLQESQFWNQGYRAIQGTKPIAIASLNNSGRVPIINNSKNILKRYQKVKPNQENFEFA